MKKIFVLVMAVVFVFTSAGLCFASQTDDGDSLGGLTDLFSGLGDSLGTATEGEDGEGGNALSGIMDMFSGITDSVQGEDGEGGNALSGIMDMFSGITDSVQGEDGEGGNALSGIMNMFSGITDGIKGEDGNIDTGSILSGLGGLFSGLADSGAEESVDAQPAEAVDVQTEDVQEEFEYSYELNWEDIEEAVEKMGLTGTLVTFEEMGVEIWIPEFLLDTEIPEELADAGYIGLFMTEDDEAYVSAQFVPADITLEDYEELLGSVEDMVDGLEKYLINGQPCLIYYVSESDSMALATMIEGEGILEFVFAPMSMEEFAAYVDIMITSIRPVEAE